MIEIKYGNYQDKNYSFDFLNQIKYNSYIKSRKEIKMTKVYAVVTFEGLHGVFTSLKKAKKAKKKVDMSDTFDPWEEGAAIIKTKINKTHL